MSDDLVKLTTGTSLRSFIASVIDEGVKSTLHRKALTEKEKQEATASSNQKAKDPPEGNQGGFLGGDSDDSDGDDEATSSKTMDDETEKLRQGDIKPKDIVEKLNSIRSGKSFKDSAVSGAMEEYIGSMSKAEKVALLAFLKGIAQIVTGEVAANHADEPSKHPADVHMDKANEPHVVHKHPNVIKAAGKPSEKKGARAEDTSAPAPIVPKRR